MFKNKLQPMPDSDKAILILSFLEERGEVKPSDYENLPIEEVQDQLLGTTYYTLINALELFYLYRRNPKFNEHINSLGTQFGISLKGLKLCPRLLLRLGMIYIETRPNLLRADKDNLAESWINKYTDIDKNFPSEDDACKSWVDDIIQALQIYESMQDTGTTDSASQWGPGAGGVMVNDTLKERYLSFRSMK